MNKTLLGIFIITVILFAGFNNSISDITIKDSKKYKAIARDYGLNSYIGRNEQYIRTNKIKSIKVTNSNGVRNEFYNYDGILKKIEYPNTGFVDLFKIDERYYYKVIAFEFEEIENIYEMNTEFFIDRLWPHRQANYSYRIVLSSDRIELIYTDAYDTKIADYYIYNEDVKVAKILEYSYSYEYDSPSYEVPKDFKLRFKNENIIPELTEITKFIYDVSGKLISVEIEDIKENKTTINYLQYNERGLVATDEEGQIIEYEYYE